ncbi:MAG: flagellar assembly protein T N-terminal domain-containing protein [candidate division WOR-3 bacterium]
MRALTFFLLILPFVFCYQPAYTAKTGSSTPAPGSEVVLSGGEGVEVLAEGVAAITGEPDIARDGALRDALRKAVEQAVGSFINAETRVQNFQLLSDRIYANSSGYVASYRVVSESREQGLYRVVIRARVKTDRIENDLQAIGILLNEQGRPRVLVVVQGDEEGDEDAGFVEARISGYFAERGFPVVDRQTLEQNLAREQLRRLIAGDSAAAQLAGLRTGAEIGIVGRLNRSQERRRSPYTQTETQFYQAGLVLRAVNLQTAAVLATSTVSLTLPFSRTEVLNRVADSSSRLLMNRILAGWSRRTNTTEIVCRNAGYEKVERLKTELSTKLRGVVTVVSRELAGDQALIEVVSETTTQEVLSGLQERGFTVRFEVLGWTNNRIEIKFTD